MAANTLPDQAYLTECFSYDPVSGELRWKARPVAHFADARSARIANTKCAGKPIRRTHDGYGRALIAGHYYRSNRIIWKLMTGEDPQLLVDHRDQNTRNDRWDNLRIATRTQNLANSKLNVRNLMGLKGVARDEKGRIKATIWHGKRNVFLGHFKTAEDAHEAYCAAARRFYGEFWSAG